MNLQNDESYLPSHYDEVANDGFGKTITSVAIKDKGDIVISDYFKDGKPSYCFLLKEGQLYILYQYVRNFCTHGVVGTNVNSLFGVLSKGRVTINLRFKMHTREEMNELNKLWLLDTEEVLKPGKIQSLRNVESNYEPETGDVRIAAKC